MTTGGSFMRGVMVRLNILLLPPRTFDIGGAYDKFANGGHRPIFVICLISLAQSTVRGCQGYTVIVQD